MHPSGRFFVGGTKPKTRRVAADLIGTTEDG